MNSGGPGGEERNDYEHPSFKAFGYDKHGRDWSEQKADWHLAKDGQEQSPINLYRTDPGDKLDGDFRTLYFDDEQYKHRYGVNYEQSKANWRDYWTGTTYQVKLNHRKDFLTTQCINLFHDINEAAKKNRN